MKKFVKFSEEMECEVTSYFMAKMDHKIEFPCRKNELGKLLGVKGKQILHIQHASGTWIGNTSKDNKNVVFEIVGDSEEKVQQANVRMQQAYDGRYDCEQ
jgi:hypothetical protein